MCGICGIAPFDNREEVNPAKLERMTRILTHRGPDSGGFHCEPGIALGIRRLSIIDLETGDQPISNEDGTIHLICNGEIYNYRELRTELESSGHVFSTNSDVEAIVHLYEDYGNECLNRLRGMFGFALWDKRNRSLLLARDRLGIKPLHYALNKGNLYFASEQKSILATDGMERKIDPQAMQTLFAYGFVTGKRNLCKGIYRLRPGQFLTLKQGSMSVRNYWDVRFSHGSSQTALSADEWADALRAKLEESVRLHLRSDVPVGAWLSAGLDSSSVAALMSRMSNSTVKTFSIAFENPDYDEVTNHKTLDHFPDYDISNEHVICRFRDFELLPKAIWFCEDLSTSGIEIPRMMLSELTSKYVKVVLTGEGADEIFGGYGWFHADKYLRPLAALPLFIKRLMLLGPLIPHFKPVPSRIHLAPKSMNSERYRTMVGSSFHELKFQIFSNEISRLLAQTDNQGERLSPPADFQRWHPFHQLMYHEIKTRLPDFITRDLDLTSMAHSVEARVPFLDHQLVELCTQIPPALKMKGLNEKYILRKALHRYLPQDIVRRKKRGLRAPFEQWLSGPLPDFAEELLSERCIREKGYFDAKGVKRLIGLRHRGSRDFNKHLMGVLVIQLWDDIFLRNLRGASF